MNNKTLELKLKSGYFAVLTFCYALFYTFCMYNNDAGITFPFFIAGSIGYLSLCSIKLGTILKKENYFLAIAAFTIAVATILTDSEFLILLNKAAIFILIITMVIRQAYDTSAWQLNKYICAYIVSFFGPFSCLFRVFKDTYEYNHKEKKAINKNIFYVLIGIIITIPILIVVLLLLSSADIVFKSALNSIFKSFDVIKLLGMTINCFMFFVAAYALLAFTCEKTLSKEDAKKSSAHEPVIAITVTGILSFIYLLFAGIQIAFLFVGNLSLPAEYTYAQYAKEGFYQLLAVSVINLIIVISCIALFRENKVLKILLTIFSLCTYVMIASSAMRMIMYIRYYFLSLERILVLWALLALAIVFIGVIMAIYKPAFKLFDYTLVVVTVLYILLAFARPDYVIAKVNLSYAPASGEDLVLEDDFFLSQFKFHDYYYLLSLSADAAEPVAEYTSNIQARNLLPQSELEYFIRITSSDKYYDLNFRTFNVSRYTAYKAFNN